MLFKLSASSGRDPWMARIDGKDEKYGFARSFVRGERTKDWGLWCVKITVSAPGLYEIGGTTAADEQYAPGFLLVFMKDGKLSWARTSKSRATAIVEAMSTGQDFESARLATKPAA